MRFFLYVEIDPSLSSHTPVVNAWLKELESISPDIYLHPSRTKAWLDLTTIKALVESFPSPAQSTSLVLNELKNYSHHLSRFQEKVIQTLLIKKLSPRYIRKIGFGPSFFWSAQLSSSLEFKPTSVNQWLRRWLFTDIITWPNLFQEILLPSSLAQTRQRIWQNLIQDLRSLGYLHYADFLRYPLTQTALTHRWGELGEYLYTECYQWPAFTPLATKTLAQTKVLSFAKTLEPVIFDPQLLLAQIRELWNEAQSYLQTQSLNTHRIVFGYRLEWTPKAFFHELKLLEPAREFEAWLPLLKRIIEEKPAQANSQKVTERFEGSQLGIEWIGLEIYVEKQQAKQLSLFEDPSLPLQEAARWVELCQHWGVAWGRLTSQEHPLPEKQNLLKPLEPKHFFSRPTKINNQLNSIQSVPARWEPCLWLNPPLQGSKGNWLSLDRGPTEWLEPWGEKKRYYSSLVSREGLLAWCYQEELDGESFFIHGWFDPRPFFLVDKESKPSPKTVTKPRTVGSKKPRLLGQKLAEKRKTL